MIDDRLSNFSVENYLEQPWLARQAAGFAASPGDINVRAAILIELAALPLKQQTACLVCCADRDILIKKLAELGEYGVVISLLHSDLARWLPETGEFDDLVWLIKNLIWLKGEAAGKKARVIMLTKAGREIKESAAMLEAIIDEAVAAAAAACVRCLNGPGGDHRIWEIPGVLEEPDLAESFLYILSADPRALALLLEDDRPEFSKTALDRKEQAAYIQKGAAAASFCLRIITDRLAKMTDSNGV